jgi:gliding motility-associated lipoprotein GldD
MESKLLMMLGRVLFLFILSLSFFIISCNSPYLPQTKRKGYFKIEFPEKEYQLFNEPGYPYEFEYPVYADIIKDTSFFEDKPENPWWINIDVPQFNGKIHISYKNITSRNKMDTLVNDAFKMAYKQHVSIASDIEEVPLQNPNGAEGIYFSLKGNTATANQFFLTDSTRHFLRGALYFDAAPNEDSLGIVNSFLKKDLEHLINTLKWK